MKILKLDTVVRETKRIATRHIDSNSAEFQVRCSVWIAALIAGVLVLWGTSLVTAEVSWKIDKFGSTSEFPRALVGLGGASALITFEKDKEDTKSSTTVRFPSIELPQVSCPQLIITMINNTLSLNVTPHSENDPIGFRLNGLRFDPANEMIYLSADGAVAKTAQKDQSESRAFQLPQSICVDVSRAEVFSTDHSLLMLVTYERNANQIIHPIFALIAFSLFGLFAESIRFLRRRMSQGKA